MGISDLYPRWSVSYAGRSTRTAVEPNRSEGRSVGNTRDLPGAQQQGAPWVPAIRQTTIRQTTNPGGAGRGRPARPRRGGGLDWREGALEDRVGWIRTSVREGQASSTRGPAPAGGPASEPRSPPDRGCLRHRQVRHPIRPPQQMGRIGQNRRRVVVGSRTRRMASGLSVWMEVLTMSASPPPTPRNWLTSCQRL
jgi:hypothetical protein